MLVLIRSQILPSSGAKYTWSNNQVGVAFIRIDRFLISKDRDEHFACAIQFTNLPRVVSDHRLKLSSHLVDSSLRPFRFENYYLLLKGGGFNRIV